MPHSSVRHSMAPTPEMPSTAKTAGVCGDDPADRLDRMAGSRRGLAQRTHHADRVGMLPQRLGDLIGVDRLPPLGLERSPR